MLAYLSEFFEQRDSWLPTSLRISWTKPLTQNKHYQHALQVERDLLSAYGLDVQRDVKIFNLEVSPNEFVHTINVPGGTPDARQGVSAVEGEKPKMLCLHGYWSSNISYARALKLLSKHYDVYCIDLPGQALSSRPRFDCETPEEILDFFTTSIEQWRDKLEIDKFSLVGHSFGGYVAAAYAMRHPDRIRDLTLISPAGVKDDQSVADAPEKQKVHESIVFFVMRHQGILRQLYYIAFSAAWSLHATVSGIYQKPFFPGRWLLTNYLESQLKPRGAVGGTHQQQLQAAVAAGQQPHLFDQWYSYYDAIMRLPVSSERAMTGIFHFPSFTAKRPLEHALQLFSQHTRVPVHFFYGDQDWMESETARRLITSGAVRGSFTVVSNAGHNVQFDNPDEMCERFAQILLK